MGYNANWLARSDVTNECWEPSSSRMYALVFLLPLDTVATAVSRRQTLFQWGGSITENWPVLVWFVGWGVTGCGGTGGCPRGYVSLFCLLCNVSHCSILQIGGPWPYVRRLVWCFLLQWWHLYTLWCPKQLKHSHSWHPISDHCLESLIDSHSKAQWSPLQNRHRIFPLGWCGSLRVLEKNEAVKKRRLSISYVPLFVKTRDCLTTVWFPYPNRTHCHRIWPGSAKPFLGAWLEVWGPIKCRMNFLPFLLLKDCGCDSQLRLRTIKWIGRARKINDCVHVGVCLR